MLDRTLSMIPSLASAHPGFPCSRVSLETFAEFLAQAIVERASRALEEVQTVLQDDREVSDSSMSTTAVDFSVWGTFHMDPFTPVG